MVFSALSFYVECVPKDLPFILCSDQLIQDEFFMGCFFLPTVICKAGVWTLVYSLALKNLFFFRSGYEPKLLVRRPLALPWLVGWSYGWCWGKPQRCRVRPCSGVPSSSSVSLFLDPHPRILQAAMCIHCISLTHTFHLPTFLFCFTCAVRTLRQSLSPPCLQEARVQSYRMFPPRGKMELLGR